MGLVIGAALAVLVIAIDGFSWFSLTLPLIGVLAGLGHWWAYKAHR